MRDTPNSATDLPDGEEPSGGVAEVPSGEPSAPWPGSDGDSRSPAGGFRPEPIRFGQGGRMEPVGGRPVNGHDGSGRGRRAVATAEPDARPGTDGDEEVTVVDLTAVEASIATADAASAGAPASGVAAVEDALAEGAAPAATDTAVEAPVDAADEAASAVPGAADTADEESDTFALRTDGAPVPAVDRTADELADQPIDQPIDRGRELGGEQAREQARRRARELTSAGPARDVPEPPTARTLLPEADDAGDLVDETPFYARTQVVPPPSARGMGAVPPPHAVDPFGAPAPVAPVSTDDLLGEPASPPRSRGRLVIENGSDVVVDRDCVIGRNPEVDPDVAQGRARAVTLPDAEQRISRVHARLILTDEGVEIVDAGSVNGTWIEPPGAVGWIAMVPRVPSPLPLGSRIQVGDLVLAYEPSAPA